MSRREFPAKVKRDAFFRADGCCEGVLETGGRCGFKLAVGTFAYDHINPDGMTGEPTLENCAVLCVACHKVKTRRDVVNIARAERRLRNFIGATTTANPLPHGKRSPTKVTWRNGRQVVVDRVTGEPLRSPR